MTETERLPLRVEGRLARTLAVPNHLEVCADTKATLPKVRGVRTVPARTKVSLVLRIHSASGIPLAHASVDLQPGDRSFETPVAALAMEGYRHLSPAARRGVESRVWSRRAFASASASA